MLGKPRPPSRPPCLRGKVDENQLILILVLEWLPFGGPPQDEVWVLFGLAPEHFWARVCHLISEPGWLNIVDDVTREKIRSLAILRLRNVPLLPIRQE